MPGDNAERRADFLGRLQEAGDRHQAAEHEHQATSSDRNIGNEIQRLAR